MKVRWLGHACFLLTADDGTRVMTDPYKTGAFGLELRPPAEDADIVTVSHEHEDHNNVAAVKGNPEIVRGAGRPQGERHRDQGRRHQPRPSRPAPSAAPTSSSASPSTACASAISATSATSCRTRPSPRSAPSTSCWCLSAAIFTIDAATANRVVDQHSAEDRHSDALPDGARQRVPGLDRRSLPEDAAARARPERQRDRDKEGRLAGRDGDDGPEAGALVRSPPPARSRLNLFIAASTPCSSTQATRR